MKTSKDDVLFYLASIFAVWFALSGVYWFYLINVLISYPFGLISLLIWLYIRKENTKRVRWIPRILLIGAGLSLVAFIYLFLWL